MNEQERLRSSAWCQPNATPITPKTIHVPFRDGVSNLLPADVHNLERYEKYNDGYDKENKQCGRVAGVPVLMWKNSTC